MKTRSFAQFAGTMGLGLILGYWLAREASSPTQMPELDPKPGTSDLRAIAAAPTIHAAALLDAHKASNDDAPPANAPARIVPMPFEPKTQLGISRLGMLTYIDQKYGLFLQMLKLSPEKSRALRVALAERMTLPMAIQVVAQQQKITDSTFLEELLNDERWKSDQGIRKLLSPDEYDSFVAFDENSDLYSRAQTFSSRLAETGAPLSLEQIQTVVKSIVAISPQPLSPPATDASPDEWRTFLEKKQYENAALISQLSGSLTLTQLHELKQYLDDETAPLSAIFDAIKTRPDADRVN